MTVSALVEAAFARHRAGAPEAAEPLYRQALGIEPNNLNALQLLGALLLGALLLDAGRAREAAGLLERARQAWPACGGKQAEHAVLFCNLGAAHRAAGLALKPVVTLRCAAGRAAFSVLLLMAPGRYNTPYDFPIRQADHDVHFLLLVPGFDDDVAALGPLADLVVNLVSDAEHDDAILPLAASVVARLAKPTVNHPDAIALTGRTALPARLAGIAGCRAARIGRYPGAALRTRSEPRSTGCSPARPQRPDAAPGLRAVRKAWATPRTSMCATARPTRLTGCRSTADHLHTNDRERRLGTYLRPVALHDALAALAAGPRAVVAGGTDHYPARAVRSPDENILDISALSGLRTIARRGDAWVIPCLATWTDLIETSLPPMFAGLVAAARQVGGVQIQNAGTVVGNLCNASPAADGIPCLLALDASVELASVRGTRLLPLRGFLLGPRQIARRHDELVTAILLPALPDTTLARFDKLGGRRYLVISIAMLATVARLDANGTIADPRLAIGACSATAQRLPALEAALRGRRPDPDLVRPAHLADLAPIDDARATAAYRRAAALELLRRAVAALASPHPAVAAAA